MCSGGGDDLGDVASDERRRVFREFIKVGLLGESQRVAHAVALLQEQRGADTVQLAGRHHGDTVAEQIRLVHKVRRQHDQSALLRVLEKLPRSAARLRVHARGRLVQEDDLRAADERHREAQLALHAAGQRLGFGVHLLLEPREADHLRSLLLDLLVAEPFEQRNKLDVLDDAEVRVDGVLLRADAHGLSHTGELVREREPVDVRVAGGRLQQTRQHGDGRTLSCTVVSEQAEDLVVVHGQVEVVHGVLLGATAAKRPHQVPHTDDRDFVRRSRLDVVAALDHVVAQVGLSLRLREPVLLGEQEPRLLVAADGRGHHALDVPRQQAEDDDVDNHHHDRVRKREIAFVERRPRELGTVLRKLGDGLGTEPERRWRQEARENFQTDHRRLGGTVEDRVGDDRRERDQRTDDAGELRLGEERRQEHGKRRDGEPEEQVVDEDDEPVGGAQERGGLQQREHDGKQHKHDGVDDRPRRVDHPHGQPHDLQRLFHPRLLFFDHLFHKA